MANSNSMFSIPWFLEPDKSNLSSEPGVWTWAMLGMDPHPPLPPPKTEGTQKQSKRDSIEDKMLSFHKANYSWCLYTTRGLLWAQSRRSLSTAGLDQVTHASLPPATKTLRTFYILDQRECTMGTDLPGFNSHYIWASGPCQEWFLNRSRDKISPEPYTDVAPNPNTLFIISFKLKLEWKYCTSALQARLRLNP